MSNIARTLIINNKYRYAKLNIHIYSAILLTGRGYL